MTGATIYDPSDTGQAENFDALHRVVRCSAIQGDVRATEEVNAP
ncbi:hypothetical protein GZL_08209 [Streptomyces sp. 769]|nr:hypothetical protein GZL_08209 [Streptomyces sp. 769]